MNDNEIKRRFIAARRKIIDLDFPRLNDMQKMAVMATEGPLLLLAGAGSGKTTVLINRIANLVKYGRASDTDEVPDGITEGDVAVLEEYVKNPDPDFKDMIQGFLSVAPAPPWRIMAITFTNKAANELKERLSKMLGDSAEDIWAMTFHSACVKILRRDIDKLGFSTSFTIYDSADSVSLMKRVMKDLEISDKVFQPRYLLSCISNAKDSNISPEEFSETAENGYDPRQKVIAKVYAEYAKRLRASNALDFDDLIYYTVKLLRQNEEVRKYYQNRFLYVLVDEYQDTNNLQYMLVSLLAGGHGNLCVVGDDDQSIYKFRGATIKNILDFESQFHNARTIKLEQNYRSTSHILGAANEVIKNNAGRKDKALWTDKGKGRKLYLKSADNENEEAQYIAEQILLGIAKGESFSDYAVLYRINSLSNGLEYAFKRNGIPYKIYGGTGFFERAEIKDMLSYLCVIANPQDDIRLSRIINTPNRGIGDKTVQNVRDAAARCGVSMYDVICDPKSYPETERSGAKLAVFLEIIEKLREDSKTLTLDVLYDSLLEKSGYLSALEHSNDPQDDTRKENVLELKSSIISYITNNEAPTLEGFLSDIALYTDLDTLDGSDTAVTLMTIHSAKGLEFPTVFIVGAEDGIFPSIHAIGEPDEMEEERRLCYVAITRAKDMLYLTCSRRRMLHGKTSANPVSRFVDEISDEHIDRPKTARASSDFDYDTLDDYRDFSDYSKSGKHSRFGGDYGGRSGDYGEYARYSRSFGVTEKTEKPKPTKKFSISFDTPVSNDLPQYKEGDRITHTAFGGGTVISAKPVGGDVLIKIQFDSSGTKQLMLKTASKYMTYEEK